MNNNNKMDKKIKVSEVVTKEEYDKVKKEYLEDKNKPQQKNFNSFFKWGKRSEMNKSLKKPDLILVFLLNLKRQIEGPIMTKIYGGNFIVIRNHVYKFNPTRVFNFGKYKAVIAREFDRELVGVDDYENLVIEDYLSEHPGARINTDDPVLIKAVIMAHLSEKQKAAGGIGKWIIIVLIVIGVIAGFFLLTGNKQTPTPPK